VQWKEERNKPWWEDIESEIGRRREQSHFTIHTTSNHLSQNPKLFTKEKHYIYIYIYIYIYFESLNPRIDFI